MRADSLGTLPGETSAVRAGEESAEGVDMMDDLPTLTNVGYVDG